MINEIGVKYEMELTVEWNLAVREKVLDLFVMAALAWDLR